MSETGSSSSITRVRVKCRTLDGRSNADEAVDSRQVRVDGFSQRDYSKATVTLIGGGGIVSEIAEGCVRKGIGTAKILDGDDVHITNLNRQKFSHSDIGRNKAIQLARNLRDDGYLGSVIEGYPYYFEEALEKGVSPSSDLIVCGVDNDASRVFASRYAVKLEIPAVFVAVSRDANQGYVFVQEPGHACFGCAFPQAVSDDEKPCPGTPAIKDILKVVGGIALYAIDTILTARRRCWNFRMVYLSGFVPDNCTEIARKDSCAICSLRKE